MAVIAPADFRAATLAEYCSGLALSTTDVSNASSEALLTAAIARLQVRLNILTNDLFEQQSLTIDLTGDGTSTLILPQRCTAVSSVQTLDPVGTYTTQLAAKYHLVSSLNAAGDTRLIENADDYIQVVPGQFLSLYWGAGTTWPTNAGGIRITGTFGWTVTPPEIKRCLALLVWNHFKPQGGILHQASRVDTADASYLISAVPPEAQEIIDDYHRSPVLVG